MRNDQIFVLLLVILLPMSGCFDGAVGDAEGTDDASDGASDSGDGSSTESSQSRTWYSSGGVYQTYWNDGQKSGYYLDDTYVGAVYNYTYDDGDSDYRSRQISSNSVRCLDFGPYYDSSTGDLLGEKCNEWGYASSESDWNLTDCVDNGGEIIWSSSNYDPYRYAPTCRMTFATINSSVGEALLIFEWSGFSMASTCSGVDVYTASGTLTGKEYVIAPGTALECSHQIYKDITYSAFESYFEYQSIWSIVYAIQDTTVV